jgi:hypothetical protein
MRLEQIAARANAKGGCGTKGSVLRQCVAAEDDAGASNIVGLIGAGTFGDDESDDGDCGQNCDDDGGSDRG